MMQLLSHYYHLSMLTYIQKNGLFSTDALSMQKVNGFWSRFREQSRKKIAAKYAELGGGCCRGSETNWRTKKFAKKLDEKLYTRVRDFTRVQFLRLLYFFHPLFFILTTNKKGFKFDSLGWGWDSRKKLAYPLSGKNRDILLCGV